MPRDTAQARVKAGRLDATTVTVERPETTVRGPNGDFFTLPRRPSDTDVVVYHKVNGRIVDPASGQRLKCGRRSISNTRPQTLSFSAVALTAFIGFRVFQLVRRCFRKQPSPEEQRMLLLQQQLAQQQQQQQQQQPPVRVFPSMLQRALPQLGPPSRVKRIAQQHKSRQRRIPNAYQKMQQRGVVQRRMTTLEKWDNAAKQQAQALMVVQQQSSGAAAGTQQLDCSRTALPLPGLPGSAMMLPQPLLEVAEAAQQE